MSESTMSSETRRPEGRTVTLSWEWIGWIVLLLGSAGLRLYELGHRVMSHDESLHTYYSWKLYDHGEYIHDPMMHGPLLFHGTALMYYVFGDNDFAARMFSVLLGLLLVASPLLLRRWLGPAGALMAGLMLTVSPNILYYTRYIRHDIHVELFTVLMFVGFIRFLDDRRGRWIVLAFAAASLAIASAEMAYINGFVLITFIVLALITERLPRRYSDPLAVVLGGVGLGLLVFGYLAVEGLLNTWLTGLPDFTQPPWKEIEQAGILFGGLLVIWGGIVNLIASLRLTPEQTPAEEAAELAAIEARLAAEEAAEAGAAGEAEDEAPAPAPRLPRRPTTLGDLLFDRHSALLTAAGLLVLALGLWRFQAGACLSELPDATLFLGLPACQVAAGLLAVGAVLFVYGLLGWLLQGAEDRGLASAITRAPAESIVLASVLAFAIYTLLYTTFFTNPDGFDGILRSVRYWVEQHGVVRGDQPFYYYGLLSPLYEFLPLAFALAAAWVYLRHPALRVWRGSGGELGSEPRVAAAYFVPGLLAWAAGVFWIYSWAGEKMPWLVTHLVVPQIFLAARLLSDTIEVIDWPVLRQRLWALTGLWLLIFVLAAVQVSRLLYSDAGWPSAVTLLTLGLLAAIGWWARDLWQSGRGRDLGLLALGLILLLALGQVSYGLLGGIGQAVADLPGALGGLGGAGLAQGLLGLALLAAAGWGLWRMSEGLPAFHVRLLGALALALLLLLVNTRVALVASFVNEERATEYLVYAHATDEGNTMLERLETLQERVGDRDLVIGYDNEVSWPYTWYFRPTLWPGARYLGEKPSGSAQLRELDVAIVGAPNYGNFEDYLTRDFNAYEYDRMWWPNEGYKGFGLDRASVARLVDILRGPETRRNILDIVIKREYRQDPNLPASPENAKSLDSWFHHAKMKMWVRREIDDQAGQAAAAPGDVEPTATSVMAVTEPLELDVEQRYERDAQGQPLLAPKGIAVDDAGRLYVVDHENARILIFDAEGQVQASWLEGQLRDASDGPSAWGIGVAPDGSVVYVADTWNHQVLKVEDGAITGRWGRFGTPPTPGEELDAMYGPRDIAVDAQGRVYVADTGNKRVTIFDADGQGIAAIGGGGLEPGQFDEPTSIAIDPATGNLYVADLWNSRVQVFDADRRPIRQWPVEGWLSLDAQHKAYLDVHPAGFVIFSDPEKSRVWLYDDTGTALGVMSLPMDDVGLDAPIGVAFDGQGRIYVAATQSNLVTRYAAPAAIQAALAGDGEAPAEDGAVDEGDAGSEAAGGEVDTEGAGGPDEEAAAEDAAGEGGDGDESAVDGASEGSGSDSGESGDGSGASASP